VIQPSDAKGGEPFAIQPQIAVYDPSGLLAPSLNGYVYAEMGSSPTGYETLWVGTCNLTSCGIEAIRNNARANFDNGVASFEVATHSSGWPHLSLESSAAERWSLFNKICCCQQ
jgi:hypothetical protein